MTQHYSHSAESAIIATLMVYHQYAVNFIADLKVDQFYDPAHRIIIKAMMDLITDNKQPEMITLYNKLRQTGENLKIGDLNGLRMFLGFESHPEIMPEWFAEVKEAWRIRSLEEIANQILNKIRIKSKSDEIHDFIQSKMKSLETSLEEGGLVADETIMDETIAHIKERIKNKGKISGLTTSFKELDEYTHGYRPGHVTVVGARTGVGKTAFAINTATNLVLNENKVVAFYSLEMPRIELMCRMLSSSLNIPSDKFSDGSFTPDEIKRINDRQNEFKQKLIFMNDKASVNVLDIAAECRQLKRKKGQLDMIIIDYLQIVKAIPGAGKFMIREQEVAKMSMELKTLAKELECPIMVLAQLNRGLENRTDQRPKASDLRESGQIENDADVILLLHRDEVINKESDKKGLAEVIIGKNRHGRMGTVELAYVAPITSFRNIEKF